MINLTLKRIELLTDCTRGVLLLNNTIIGVTLEDGLRHGYTKITRITAIPAGRYDVTITHSPRFGVLLPLLHNVPDFSGIRLHAGNKITDTDGCLLIADSYSYTHSQQVVNSRPAMSRLMQAIGHCTRLGMCDITITNHF
jgi:Family of unknown function (DUF5675)